MNSTSEGLLVGRSSHTLSRATSRPLADLGRQEIEISSRFVHIHQRHLTREYVPSLYAGGSGAYLSTAHTELEQLVGGVHGKLEPGDHYKLYEVAYFSQGPVLEIGRLHGKSTVILALGMRDGAARGPLISIELEDRYLKGAKRHLAAFGLQESVQLLQGDSATIVKSLSGSFDTVFVDGDHSYAGVARDIDALAGRIRRNGLMLFHDYFHPHNDTGEYGVKRAVDERVAELRLEFRGRFGGIALFEHVA